MVQRSTMALLAHVKELVWGREEGSHGESGWTSGAYADRGQLQGKRVIRNCLNGALRVAERDVFQLQLFGGDTGDPGYAAPMATDEGKSAQRILAEACWELSEHVREAYRQVHYGEDGNYQSGYGYTEDSEMHWVPEDGDLNELFSQPQFCHVVIVTYNDSGNMDEDAMDAALELAEKKSYQEWLDAHPLPPNDDFSDFESFIEAVLADTPVALKKTT